MQCETPSGAALPSPPVAARLNHCRNRLKAVLDPVGHFLHQHADTLVRDRCSCSSLTRCLTSSIARRIWSNLVARPIDLARVKHHCAPAD